jgi:hypothetical protein
MIASIHQPHFLPWLGYFNKVFNSDVFVWLHKVQFRKNYFQNRTKIKDPILDRDFWLTIPVHAKLSSYIDEVTLSEKGCLMRLEKTIFQFYRRAPFFSDYYERLVASLNISTESLEEVNFSTFKFLLQELKYSGKLVRFDELNVEEDDPNLRLIAICKAVGADHYIAGKGGKNYLEENKWEMAGIKLSWQQMESDLITYPQLGKTFLPSLSIVDCLFNTGAEQTRELIQKAWKVNR